MKPFQVFTYVMTAWLALAGFVYAQGSAPKSSLTIASHNIHYITPNRDSYDWPDRREAVARVIGDIQPDVIAFQEMETFTGGHFTDQNLQLDWVLENFPNFAARAVGDPAIFPITQPIVYNAERLALLDQGFFFFSDTPDEIYSRQWDGRYPYFCTWVKLQDSNTQQTFYVFNMHNDYASRSNRVKTTELIMQRIPTINTESAPLVLVGDFNAPKGFKEVKNFREIGLNVIKPAGSTNRIWGMRLLPAIDHILINGGFTSEESVTVWRKKYDGVYPSDHFPISVQLNFR
jgi:endonuclease/exonuclease/phosphatase family metal-dependent hydrolase